MAIATLALHNVNAACVKDLLGFDAEFEVTYARGGIPSTAYIYVGDSCVKARLHPTDFSVAIGSPETRGAAEWALRSPGRQATISWSGQLVALEETF